MNIKTYLNLVKDKKKQNFVIYGIGQAFNLVSPLLVAPYIVFVCKEDGFGKVSLGFAVALFLILIVDYAFEIKGPKEVSENRDNLPVLHEIANTTFFSKFILFIPVLLCTSLIIYFVPFFYKEKELFFFSMAVVLAQVCNPTWFLQGVENFRALTVINIASKVSYIVLVYVLIKHKEDYILVNLILGGTALVFNAAGIIYLKKIYAIKAKAPGASKLKAILKADFSFCISQLFLSARQHLPAFAVSYFLGFYATGQYKIIEQVISMFRTFIQVFLRFFYPAVNYKISKDFTQGFNFWKKYTLSCFAFTIPSLIIIYIFSAQILVFFNASAQTIITLNTTFRLSLCIPLLMSASLPLEQLMFVLNKNKQYIAIIISATITTIVLVLFSVQRFELDGVILSVIFSEFMLVALFFYNSFWFSHKEVNKTLI